MLVRILQSVLGTPVAMAPAKALCSKGERWYLVCPRTVANLPNSKPRRIEDTLILSLSKRFCNLLDKQWWRTSIWNDRSVLREIITNAKWWISLKEYVFCLIGFKIYEMKKLIWMHEIFIISLNSFKFYLYKRRRVLKF